MQAIVRKRQQRKITIRHKGDLTFQVRGEVVNAEKVDRWMKRHGIPESTIYAPSPAASERPNYISLEQLS